jgi:acyl-CoA thioester hydrolase
MIGDRHCLDVRVYYEDTDFSGRVYHASYFRFFERGRTEWLRARGLEHNALAENDGLAFAVTRLNADFLAAGVIDDLLQVVTALDRVKGPVLTFAQVIRKGDADLAKAEVDVVAIKGRRAVRPPKQILGLLRD